MLLLLTRPAIWHNIIVPTDLETRAVLTKGLTNLMVKSVCKSSEFHSASDNASGLSHANPPSSLHKL